MIGYNPLQELQVIKDLSLPDPFLNELENLIGIITANGSVRTIILFGSTVQGTRTEHSDIDLLVLHDSSFTDSGILATQIRKNSKGMLSFPLDLIVESLQEYQDRSVLPTLERKIAREGQILYAA